MKLEVRSWFSDGELTVAIDGREYTYYEVSEYALRQVKRLARRTPEKALKYLKPFSDKERYRECDNQSR